jgi:serine phosphatase RsbU (regulator of sigma subunit)
VRSKNQYQKTGKTASYRFEVMSPWYRTWLAYFLYLVIGLLLIWLIVRFNIERLLKQKEQLEKTVAERTAEVVAQKKQIEKAHNEITASINYAKYIQSSVFPKTEDLKSCLGNYFILHKPVEIVSGDFYWVSQKDRKTIVVAADCTGHGVPGAFMSMLGITLLDEIVNKGNITDPGAILNRLREEVIDSLQQKGERGEQKDGMDIAVCTFDQEEMKMQFAGANNPLYLIREADGENAGISHPQSGNNAGLTEIKGNRMPIGIFDEMDEFTVHEIEISKGDTYYLFTDGFPDQFGGPKRRKFSYKQFRELLLKTQSQLMDDQKYRLEESLNEWMGVSGQTDDILVIGFRIE